MPLKISPTPSDFSIIFPVRDTYKPRLKAGIVITNVREMMFAMGKEFGKVFDTQQATVVPKIFDAITQYIESAEQQNEQPVTGICLATYNKVRHAGIPEALVYMQLFGGHGSPEQRKSLTLQDEAEGCRSIIKAVAHDFIDGGPIALVSSTAMSDGEEIIPLTKCYTAQPLNPDEPIPSHIEKPITEKTQWPRGTRVVFPVRVLDEDKLRHPDAKDITLHSITEDVRNRLTGTELLFLRFLKDKKSAEAAAVQQAV